MAELRPKIVKLCKVVGGLTGVVNKIDENAPEYYALASILTDDEADVAIAAGLRKERTVEYLAKKVGKPVDEVQKIAAHILFDTDYNLLIPSSTASEKIASSCRSSRPASWRCW